VALPQEEKLLSYGGGFQGSGFGAWPMTKLNLISFLSRDGNNYLLGVPLEGLSFQLAVRVDIVISRSNKDEFEPTSDPSIQV
jgi:hypothetical protein